MPRPRSVLVLRLTAFALGALLVACGGRDEGAGPGGPRIAGSPDAAVGSPYAADGAWRDGRPLPAGGTRPNLIVVVVDTLRRDAVGLPGEPQGPMPWLEAHAARGVAFRHAVAPAPWTVPSMASMLCGLAPHEHGLLHPDATPMLVEAVTTYAEVLHRAYGYETAAFTDGPWFRGRSGSLLQGFADGSADRHAPPGHLPPPGSGYWLDGTPELVGAWLARRDPRRPFFLLLHTFEAHDPYGPENALRRTPDTPEVLAREERAILAFDVASAPTPKERARVFLLDRIGRRALDAALGQRFMTDAASALYDGFDPARDAALLAEVRRGYDRGLRTVDDGLASTFQWLETAGLLEGALVVVAADHGEGFAEHGHVGHGNSLHDEVVRVPLMLNGPAPFDRPLVVETPVSLTDVLPTFFDWAGFEPLPGRMGRSLLPTLEGQRTWEAAPSEMLLTDSMAGRPLRLLGEGARSEAWKYLITLDLDTGDLTEELYDLRADPGAQHSLVGRERAWPAAALPEGFCREVEAARQRLQDAARRPIPARNDFEAPVHVSWERPPPCSGT